MSPADTPSGADNLILLDDLHARYDGRPPRRQRLAALVAGTDVLDAMAERASRERLPAQASAARMAVARRRRHLPAALAMADPWLFRLTCALRDARDAIDPCQRS
ncbi:MAG: hypothetical protein ACOVN0_18980 [Niveispirillum sp.]|uniref:hypothetical protein n=1 Tax=Niveispirillum sp. TaxID=1917217 RepID=UPI003BA60643